MINPNGNAKDSLDPHNHEHQFSRERPLSLQPAPVSQVLLPAGGDAASSSEDKCRTEKAPMEDLEGKVAFITGGSSGIGLGIARACVDAGMKVAIGYRTREHADEAMAQLAGAGNQVLPIWVDVTDRRSLENAAAETVKTFDKVHMLVNNAGVITGKPMIDSSYEDWDWIMSVNLTGVFNGIRTFLPYIKSHGEGGHIVTTSSILGIVVGPSIGIYSTSKVAAVGLMEALRSELAQTNISASVFCPGFVRSSLGDAARNRPGTAADTVTKPLDSQKSEQNVAAQNPEASWMDPIEAGRLVLRGIRNNHLYIFTHPEFEQGIRDRNDALLASIPHDLHPPEERVFAEREILRNTIYVTERDRKWCSHTVTAR